VSDWYGYAWEPGRWHRVTGPHPSRSACSRTLTSIVFPFPMPITSLGEKKCLFPELGVLWGPIEVSSVRLAPVNSRKCNPCSESA
jgi:hypothetical protein